MSIESDALDIAYLRYILQCRTDYGADKAMVPQAKWDSLQHMIEKAYNPIPQDKLTNAEKTKLDHMLTLATDPSHPSEIVEFYNKGVLVGRARI